MKSGQSVALPEIVSDTSSDDAHFYFAQITDTHLGGERSFRHARQIIDLINRLPVDVACVVHTGDVMDDNIADTGKVSAAIELFQESQAPVHFVPGNHDILDALREPTETAYRTHFGDRSRSIEYHGVLFLLLHTPELAAASDGEAQRILAALEVELAAANGRPVLLFQHAPSMASLYRGRDFLGGCTVEVLDAWQRLLSAHNVKAVMAGHTNQDHHHWIGPVPVYVCPPVLAGRGRQPSFRLFEYVNGQVGYWTVTLDPPKALRHRLKDKLKKYAR